MQIANRGHKRKVDGHEIDLELGSEEDGLLLSC
jgi:hypothetical protein